MSSTQKKLNLDFEFSRCIFIIFYRGKPHHKYCYDEIFLGKKKRTASVFTFFRGTALKLMGLGGGGGATGNQGNQGGELKYVTCVLFLQV